MCTRTPAHTHMDVHAIVQIWNTQGEDLHCIRCRQIIYKDAVGTKDIPCDGCQHEVRRKYFEQEQLDLWDAKEPGNYVCRKCQGTLGGTRMEDREVFECTNCRRKWTDCHFLDETIAAWKAKSKASLWCAQGHEETQIVYKCWWAQSLHFSNSVMFKLCFAYSDSRDIPISVSSFPKGGSTHCWCFLRFSKMRKHKCSECLAQVSWITPTSVMIHFHISRS